MKIQLRRETFKGINTYLIFALFLLYVVLRPVYRILEDYSQVPSVNFSVLIAVGITIVLFIECISALTTNKIARGGSWQLLSLVLLIWVILLQVVQAPLLIADSNVGSEVYLMTISSTVFGSILMWLVGSNAGNIWRLIEGRGRVVIYCLFGLLALIIVHSVLVKGEALSIDTFTIATSGSGNYLEISDDVALTALLAFSLTKNRLGQLFVALLGAVMLFATLSRTSFYIFVLVVTLVLAIRNVKYLVVTGLILLLLVSETYLPVNLTLLSDNASNRMLRLVADRLTDGSYQMRRLLLQEGIKDLHDTWLTGEFLLEAKEGHRGGYVHNWLSFWIAYGIGPFVLFCVLFVRSGLKSSIVLLHRSDYPFLLWLSAYALFTGLCIVFSRSYVYPYVWFALGAPWPSKLRHPKGLEDADQGAFESALTVNPNIR